MGNTAVVATEMPDDAHLVLARSDGSSRPLPPPPLSERRLAGPSAAESYSGVSGCAATHSMGGKGGYMGTHMGSLRSPSP